MVKKQKEEETDPDPTPYLFVSLEQKRIDQTKPYDAKKACWVPDEAEGFLQGEIKATKGEVVTVILPNGEVSLKGQSPGVDSGLDQKLKFLNKIQVNTKRFLTNQLNVWIRQTTINFTKFKRGISIAENY